MLSFERDKESTSFCGLSLNDKDEFCWLESNWHKHKEVISIVVLQNGRLVKNKVKIRPQYIEYYIEYFFECETGAGYYFSDGQHIVLWGKKTKPIRKKNVDRQRYCQSRRFFITTDGQLNFQLPDSLPSNIRKNVHAGLNRTGPVILDMQTGEVKPIDFPELCPTEVLIHPSESMVAFLDSGAVYIIDL